MPIRGDYQQQLQRIIEVQSIVAQADLDLSRFMQLVVDTLQDLTHAKGVVVEIADGDDMLYRCASSSLSQFVGIRLKRQGSLSGLCVTTARVLRCDDSETDERVDRDACRRVGVRSMICTPLFQAGIPVGVLKVMSDRPRGFNEADVQALTLLGSALGAAMGRQVAFDALQNAESQLRSSEMRLRILLEHANDAVISVNENAAVIRWNRAAEILFGWQRDEAIGHDLIELIIPPEEREQLRTIIAPYIGGSAWPGGYTRHEFRAMDRAGHHLVAEASVSRHRFDEQWEFTAFVHDVTERKRMQEALRDMAEVDALTKVANRNKIMAELTHAVTRTRRKCDGLALFFMDLNGFKKINDTFGHEMGDKALCVFAERLIGSVRQSDLVGRLGGDEFVILTEGVHNEEQALIVATKIISALAKPIPGTQLHLQTSIGVSLYRPPLDANQWLVEADQAMYQAKRSGAAQRIVVYKSESSV